MVGKTLIAQMHKLLLIVVAYTDEIFDEEPFADEGLIEGVLKGAIRENGIDKCDSIFTGQPLRAMRWEGSHKFIQSPMNELRARIEIQRLRQAPIDRIRVETEDLRYSMKPTG